MLSALLSAEYGRTSHLGRPNQYRIPKRDPEGSLRGLFNAEHYFGIVVGVGTEHDENGVVIIDENVNKVSSVFEERCDRGGDAASVVIVMCHFKSSMCVIAQPTINVFT